MSVYECQTCNETWDVNRENGLIPSKYPYGYWISENDITDNCPACCDIDGKGKWEWVE